MLSVRTIGMLAILGAALTAPGFAAADGQTPTNQTSENRASENQAPVKLRIVPDRPSGGQDAAKASFADSSEKFIYLDDGSGSADKDEAARARNMALKNAPARSIFPYDSERAAIDAAQLGLRQSKRPVLVLEPQNSPALAGGIRIDGFGATSAHRTTVQIGDRKNKAARDGFGVWMTSETAPNGMSAAGGSQAIDLALEPVATRPNYNVGLNIGYEGFTLGASVLREQNGINLAYQGYDIGIGYMGRSWYTNLQVAGFRNDSNPLYYNFMGDRFRAFELGAGYIIWPGFTFSGRFKYFDYGNPVFDSGAGEEQHIFSLDTKLNF